MAQLIPLSNLTQDRNYDFRSEGIYDPTGSAAYGADGSKLGTVRGALVQPDTGRLRYLIVDVGGWFTSKEVVVPVGTARIEDDAVYFDNLSKDQVRNLREYRYGESYDDDAQLSDERVFRSDATSSASAVNYRDEDAADTLFKTPQRLRLLEERLVVDKDRYRAGSVEVSKHVENREQQVNVNLTHEEVVIERHPVTDPRPVEGNVTLGAGSETIRVDLEAERANVQKQAYVTEEVEIGKRTETETRTFSETVGREVLDVNKTGEVGLGTDTGLSGRTSGVSAGAQGLSSGLSTGRLTAVFDSEADAEAAVSELRRLGIADAHLSVVRRHGESTGGLTSGAAGRGDNAASGAGKGLLTGAGIGALFGLAAALIPGVGPFITAGALATTLGAAGGGAAAGAIVGGTAGTLAGALAGAGYNRDEADYYGGAVERGGVLVAVENTDGVDSARVMDVLRRYNGHLYQR